MTSSGALSLLLLIALFGAALVLHRAKERLRGQRNDNTGGRDGQS